MTAICGELHFTKRGRGQLGFIFRNIKHSKVAPLNILGGLEPMALLLYSYGGCSCMSKSSGKRSLSVHSKRAYMMFW